MLPYNKKLVKNARALRKNMTPEEKHLWYDFLKNIPCTVHRQKVIDSYVVDFYIADAKLIVELDGSGHEVHTQKELDKIRDYRLEEQGFQVLRFTNSDVRNHFSTVCNQIKEKIPRLK